MSSDLREIFRSSIMSDVDRFVEVNAQAHLVDIDHRSVYGSGPISKVIGIPIETAEFIGRRPYVLVYHAPDRAILEIFPNRASAQRETLISEASDEHPAEAIEG
jgi:hypothetical protein